MKDDKLIMEHELSMDMKRKKEKVIMITIKIIKITLKNNFKHKLTNKHNYVIVFLKYKRKE